MSVSVCMRNQPAQHKAHTNMHCTIVCFYCFYRRVEGGFPWLDSFAIYLHSFTCRLVVAHLQVKHGLLNSL